MPERVWLLADIGGTNVRFAYAGETGLQHEHVLATNDYGSLPEAVAVYLARTPAAAPHAMCMAVAGPVANGRTRLTNNSWDIDAQQIAQALDLDQAIVLNDFEAIAHALPLLGLRHSIPLGGPAFESADAAPEQRRCLGVLGPGTGLGAAGLILQGDHATPIITEAGHAGFAPENDRQTYIHQRLRTRFRRVSIERLVSGQGIENIYWALSDAGPHSTEPQPTAAEIFERHGSQTDPLAVEAVEEFVRILGQVAGDLAMTIGSFDGVFLAGGIAQRHHKVLNGEAFRTAFEAKGRHSAMMARIPTMLITHPQPGPLGCRVVSQAQDR